MVNPSLAVGGFTGGALIAWYIKNASLSFKALLVLVIGGFTAVVGAISLIQSGGSAAQSSLVIGGIIGFVVGIIL